MTRSAAPAAEPQPPSGSRDQRRGDTAAVSAVSTSRVPPRPPRRAGFERRRKVVVEPAAVVSRVVAPSGLPAAPEPLARESEVPVSSILGEGLSDYVEAPTDPLIGLDFGRTDPQSVEIRPISPLDPQATAGAAAGTSTASGEQVAAAPPASAPRPGASGRDTRTLGGVLQEMMEPNAVVARVNGEAIYWSAVVDSARTLPEEYQDKLESVFPALLKRLVDMKLLAQRARGAGLDARADIQRKVQAFEEALLREVLLRELLDEELSDETLRQAYDDYSAEAKTHMQVKARHILLETKEDALEVIAALDAGADFARLARERSLGSSSARGGDLGVVDVSRMVAPFAEALARQPLGRHSHWPVQSDFGWHVIVVETRQGELVPPFEQIKPQLQRVLGRELIERRLIELRDEAEIEIVDSALPETPDVTRLDSE